MKRKYPAVASFFQHKTIGHLLADQGLLRRIEAYISSFGYALVMPPDAPRIGDAYLAGGTDWSDVSSTTYSGSSPFSERSYIIIRMTEHERMLRFFFK